MSRVFKEKNQDLVNLKVLTADKVWVRDKKGNVKLNKNLNIYGKVEKNSSCFITSSNLQGKNHKFVEDTSKLTKKTKNEIVNQFNNNNKRVVYLVKKK